MKCPHCGYSESKVVDSRHSEDGLSIRRRRECLGSLTATRLRKCEKALCRLIFLSIFTFCCCSTPGTML